MAILEEQTDIDSTWKSEFMYSYKDEEPQSRIKWLGIKGKERAEKKACNNIVHSAIIILFK